MPIIFVRGKRSVEKMNNDEKMFVNIELNIILDLIEQGNMKMVRKIIKKLLLSDYDLSNNISMLRKELEDLKKMVNGDDKDERGI